MANYTAIARSNYFRVKDINAFLDWAESIPGLEAVLHDDGRSVALIAEGGWPSGKRSDDGEWEDFDLLSVLPGFLLPGSVAVLIEVGHERARYLTGQAFALDSTGRTVLVDLNQIYALAEKEFRTLVSFSVSLAEY